MARLLQKKERAAKIFFDRKRRAAPRLARRGPYPLSA
jgi:hypothetical protein